MNYFEQQEREKRVEPRRLLRCKARIATQSMGTIKGDTIDISNQGISIMSPLLIDIATSATISFETWQGSRPIAVSFKAMVVNSVCVGTKGFRTGFEIREIDEINKAAIKRLSAAPS